MVVGEYRMSIFVLLANPNWQFSWRCCVMSLRGLVLGWRSARCLLRSVRFGWWMVSSVSMTVGMLQRVYCISFFVMSAQAMAPSSGLRCCSSACQLVVVLRASRSTQLVFVSAW